MVRPAIALILMLCLAACGEEDITTRPDPIGDFRLGHAIAIADDVQGGLFTRTLVEEEIEPAVEKAMRDRLGRYDGDGLYHIGVYVGAAQLALPGVPLVFVPGSNLVVGVTVFDNATRSKMNEKPYRMLIGEGIENTVPVLGSGLTRVRTEQIANLADETAEAVERWLRKQRENEGWFEPKPGQVRVPFDFETARRPAIPN